MQKKKDFNGYTKQEKRSKGYNIFQYLKKILNVGNIMNIWNSIKWIVILEYIKMPQSGVGSMQGKNTGNMPSAVFASSMNKSLDPTPI